MRIISGGSGLNWLPNLDLRRTPARARLFDEQTVYGQRRERLRYFTSSKQTTDYRRGRAAFVRNPIQFAMELRSELEAMENPSQGA